MEARDLPPAPPAPWAEVAAAGPLSTEDLLALPDDRWQYELVDGRLVRMPPSGRHATRIARQPAARLGELYHTYSRAA